MKIFPTLYKKTSTGAIQKWDISVEIIAEAFGVPLNEPVALIWTRYGQVDGAIQETADKITKGKNPGKKNATTPIQQAEAEAQSKWEKQKKKGYVESVEAAEADEVDDLIEGGINPMLAHKFADHAAKITYPAYVQPKLDGIRCIAIIKKGKCTLWSRTRKPITSMPHIVDALESISPDLDAVIDGELYNHAYKTNFEHIVSLVRQEEPDPRHTDVEYHVYDIVVDKPFSGRANVLRHMPKRPGIVVVETVPVEDEAQTMNLFDMWRKDGYEGAMIRNSDSMYENKRSYGLQKIKEFDDSEFNIIGIEEGRGKLAGHVGAFVCDMGGKTFLAKMSGDTSMLRSYFLDHSLWQGKRLTVKYQGLSGKNGVPRFPVGVSIRDYE